MEYIDRANSGYMIFYVGLVLLVVVAISLIFMRKGWKEASRLGVSDADLKKMVVNSIGVTLIPSIPIVISVIVMVPILGIPLPWLRCSVIGSANNELVCASMAVEASNIPFTALSMTDAAYVNAAWAMGIGCSIVLLWSIFVIKPVCKAYDRIKQKDSKWVEVLSLCALVSVIGVFVVDNGRKGTMPLIVIIACFVFSYLCSIVSKSASLKWVKDFSFPMTIIFGLIVSVVFTPLIL